MFGRPLTPRVRELAYATIAASIAGGVCFFWLDLHVDHVFGMTPLALVGRGDALPSVPAVWQLVTYPFFVLNPIGLVLGTLVYGWFASDLERAWGAALFVERWVTLTVGVALITALASIPLAVLRDHTLFGPTALLEGLVVAWGLTFPTRQVRLWFLLPITGQMLAWITGAFVVLSAVFGGPDAAPFSIPAAVSVGLAVGMVRFDLSLRRLWLIAKRRRIERELQKVRRDSLH